MQLNWCYFCGATPDDATESVVIIIIIILSATFIAFLLF